MENKGFKIIGTAVVAAGLLAGAFLAGGLTSGGSNSGAEPEIEPTSVIEAVEDQDEDEDNGVVLVGDEQDATQQNAAQGQGQPEAPQSTQEPVTPPLAPVEPTPAPPVVEPTPEPTPVNEAPYVVSISPEHSAIGVAINANVVVTFSEPMDKATAQGAFNLSTGNCGAFLWNGDATVMTFDPCADWAYGAEVTVEIYDSAADELGLGLADEFESAFMVLRQSTMKLWSEDAYDGHVYGPGVFVLGSKAVSEDQYFTVGTWSRGFLSFELDELPEDLVEVQSASVHVKQDSHQAAAYTGATGSLLIESVTYGSLGASDWGLTANTLPCPMVFCLIPILSMDAADGWKTTNVTGYVRADWEQREARDYNSQFRLRFSNDCGDASCPSVSATFIAGKGNGVVRPYLLLTYTHP